ncbi:MAG TPA: hypothetical protein PLL33_15420, partial [Paracoccus sp. (in: a-proteobacteria)]|nr:hypothetical protein [Paracoccus sp. (in: a-proteobacteria)]
MSGQARPAISGARARGGLPIIGRAPGHDRVFAVRGFGGNGVAFAMIACAFLQPRRRASAGEKETPDRRLSPACPQTGTPSSSRSASRRLCAARTVADRSTPSFRHDQP